MESIETQNMIREILEKNSTEIANSVREELKGKVIQQLSWSLQSKISDEVSEFVKEEFMDEVREIMIKAKPDIIRGMREGMITIGAALAECLTAKALENLEVGSYRSREIIKKIFD